MLLYQPAANRKLKMSFCVWGGGSSVVVFKLPLQLKYKAAVRAFLSILGYHDNALQNGSVHMKRIVLRLNKHNLMGLNERSCRLYSVFDNRSFGPLNHWLVNKDGQQDTSSKVKPNPTGWLQHRSQTPPPPYSQMGREFIKFVLKIIIYNSSETLSIFYVV